MYNGDKNKLNAPLALVTLIFIAVPVNSYAEEIAAFRLTNTEGHVGLKYRYDGDLSEQISSPENKEIRSHFEEEVHMQTQGYIYHPNFLKLDMGAGLIFSQESLNTVTGSTKSDDTLYDVNAKLTFLEKKPYPLLLYYNKSHPSVALNVTDVYIQENEKYGMNFSLRQPVSPISLNFESYQQSTEGESFNQVTNDRNNYQRLRADASLKNGGNLQLSYSNHDRLSLSGSKISPILPFNLKTKSTNLNSRLVFDPKRHINLTLNATNIIQEQDRKLNETRVSPNLSWKHSENFNTYYRYNFLDRTQTNVETRDTSAAAGMRYQWDKNLYSNIELHSADNNTTGLQQKSYGARGSVTYKHQLAIGMLQFNVGYNYDEFDRVVNFVAKTEDSPYTLSGSTPVTLAHDYIDSLSIVVKREDTGKVLTLNTDYRVTVIGKQTQIQKLLSSPVDLNVRVNYSYDPGGSAAFNAIGQNYQTSLELNKHVTVYLSYRDAKQSLKSGSPTRPLDSSDTTAYGLRLDYPLPTDTEITLSGDITSETHNENISSYEKNSTDLSMQFALPLSSNMNVSLRRLRIDNLFSVEDVDLTRYALRLNSRPQSRLTLSLQLSDEKDIGGSITRRSQNMIFSGQWRIRKLRVELAARRVLDTQGLIKHERTIFMAKLRRDF